MPKANEFPKRVQPDAGLEAEVDQRDRNDTRLVIGAEREKVVERCR